MITVEFKARLGNNLFQYALGRILASELGFRLDSPEIPGFIRTRDEVPGAAHHEPIDRYDEESFDYNSVVGNTDPRNVIIRGWFQDWRYYRPYRDQIREWYSLDHVDCVKPGPNDVIAHVRRTDYIGIGWALPFSFYETAINKLLPSGGRLFIATDDAADPFFKRFARWQPTYLTGGVMETMASLATAERVIMSQSTFSWWPTFLSRVDQQVICPDPSFGCWEPGRGIDLIERDRFDCIKCDTPYAPSFKENAHQKWRYWKRRGIIQLNDRLGQKLQVPSR